MTKKKDKNQQKQKAASRDESQEPSGDSTALQQERDELFDKLQRIGADYANFQKRVPKQIADAVAYEREKILKSLLPALDNFEHALQNAEGADDDKGIVKGVRIVYDQLMDILKSHGVAVIDALDQPFDPSRHEAMLRQSDPEQEDNRVLQEFQKGFMLNDRVLRPSKVVVNKIEVSAVSDADEPAPASDDTTEESKETEVT
jgi:molecular chaperone GrpE